MCVLGCKQEHSAPALTCCNHPGQHGRGLALPPKPGSTLRLTFILRYFSCFIVCWLSVSLTGISDFESKNLVSFVHGQISWLQNKSWFNEWMLIARHFPSSEMEKSSRSDKERVKNKMRRLNPLCHGHLLPGVPLFSMPFSCSISGKSAFFYSIPKNMAYKLCFLKQCYPPPAWQLSARFLKYLQNGFEERERKGCPQKLISTVYLIWLPPKDSPQPVNCSRGQVLWSIFYRRCYSPPQIFHVYQSTICYVCYCCLPLPPCLWGKEIMGKEQHVRGLTG